MTYHFKPLPPIVAVHTKHYAFTQSKCVDMFWQPYDTTPIIYTLSITCVWYLQYLFLLFLMNVSRNSIKLKTFENINFQILPYYRKRHHLYWLFNFFPSLCLKKFCNFQNFKNLYCGLDLLGKKSQEKTIEILKIVKFQFFISHEVYHIQRLYINSHRPPILTSDEISKKNFFCVYHNIMKPSTKYDKK